MKGWRQARLRLFFYDIFRPDELAHGPELRHVDESVLVLVEGLENFPQGREACVANR